MTQTNNNYQTVTAAEVLIWNEIQYANGEIWEVVTTPEYTNSIVEFEVFISSDTMQNNTRMVRFNPKKAIYFIIKKTSKLNDASMNHQRRWRHIPTTNCKRLNSVYIGVVPFIPSVGKLEVACIEAELHS